MSVSLPHRVALPTDGVGGETPEPESFARDCDSRPTEVCGVQRRYNEQKPKVKRGDAGVWERQRNASAAITNRGLVIARETAITKASI